VTELQQKEAKLMEEKETKGEIEGEYRLIFKLAYESLFIIDQVTGMILDVNQSACRTYGYSQEEFLTMNVIDISAEPEKTYQAVHEVQEEHNTIPIRYHKKKDGTVFPVEIQSSLFLMKNRKVLLSAIHDITERIQAEDLLKHQMKDLVESQRIAQIGTWRLNLETNEVIWSKELYKMYGFDPMRPVPPYTEHMKLFTLESWERLSMALEHTRKTGIPYELELNTVTIDGSNGWMWVRGEAETDLEGNIISLWGAAQDITRRKKEEANIKDREDENTANITSIIEGRQESVWAVDRNYKILYINHAFQTEFQQTFNIWLEPGINLLDAHPAYLVPLWKPRYDRMFANEQFLVEDAIETAQGIIYIQVFLNPIIKNGQVVGGSCFGRNITEYKLAEIMLRESEERFKGLSDAVFGGIIIHDKGIILECNRGLSEITGFTMEELKGKNGLELIAPESLSIVIANINSGYDKSYEVVGVRKDSSKYSLAIRGKNITYKGREARVIEFNDITERKKMEYELYKEKELFKTTLISVGDGVISTDTEGNVLIMNKVSEQLTGWTQEEAVGKPIEEVFKLINESTKERCENPVAKVLATGEIINLASNTLLISKDGMGRPVEDNASPIIDEEGNIAGVVLVFRDFTEKKKSLEEIQYLSFYDYLTGLYNRRFYENELSQLDTKRNWPLTIVMGDVNGLKLINDSFGHGTGDQLLIKVAEAIKSGCRADDIIARIGGDEFVIILTNTDGSEATHLIDRIKGLLLNERIEGLEITISFGYATKYRQADDIDVVFKKAEDAMYHNKLFEGPSIKGQVIENIIEALNNKSRREEIHARHVSVLCEKMGVALNLEEFKIKELKTFGLLHDIGKIAILDTILNKPDKLTQSEWIEMKSHAETGFRILSTNSDMKEMADYVLAHHERWDGCGYPKGLKGEEIPLPSRVCAISDAYDAMISERSYKPSISKGLALAELKNNAGTQFDPELVNVFIEKVLCK